MANNIAYEHNNKGGCVVYMNRKTVGSIRKVEGGFQYFPWGKKEGGAIFPEMDQVKRSLEGKGPAVPLNFDFQIDVVFRTRDRADSNTTSFRPVPVRDLLIQLLAGIVADTKKDSLLRTSISQAVADESRWDEALIMLKEMAKEWPEACESAVGPMAFSLLKLI